MELTHTFTVPASVDETWAALNDIESVAGCFPGASITTADESGFTGSVKVKLGPIALVYNGTGSFVEKDEAGRRMVIDAKGKDKRGNGTAGAQVTATLAEGAGGSGTDVSVLTDLTITGRPAQFGRGVIQDVSDKLLGQFVECLKSKVGSTSEAASPDVVSSDSAAGAAAAVSHSETQEKTASSPVDTANRRPPAPAASEDDDALDLGNALLPVLLKSYWKQVLAGVIGILIVRRLIRRK